MYSDPTGEFFWAPVIIGAMVGAYFGGIRADQKGESFLGGMVKGAFIGGLGGALGGIGGAGMSYAENLFLGVWEGGFTGYVDGLVWGEDPGKSMLYGMATGAVVTTLTSENLWNFFRGKGFKTNASVFEDFKAGKYPLKSDSWQQDALDYFGLNAEFEDNNLKQSSTLRKDGKTTIIHRPDSFESYDALLSTHTKEVFHSQREKWLYAELKDEYVTWPKQQTIEWIKSPEERLGVIHQYLNCGLYPKDTYNYYNVIQNLENNLTKYTKYNFIPFEQKWWHFIYKIPRRW